MHFDHDLAKALAGPCLTLALVACGSSPEKPGVTAPPTTTLALADEDGVPVAGATIDLEVGELKSDANGRVTVVLDDSAVAGVVRAEGMLAEPFVVGLGDVDQEVPVRLLAAVRNGARRWSMHSGGDVMFGRRYMEPVSGEPIIHPDAVEDGARSVVQHMARMFKAADIRTLNLETVVSELPKEAAYPGKRFILNSLPGTLAAVKELDASFVIFANNHTRDYMDEGVALSVEALNEAGLPFTGAAVDGSVRADVPVVVEARGLKVGTLAYTTVDGSFVNDNYPLDGPAQPAGIAATELWQWTPRMWGFEGETWQVEPAERRIGGAWKLFADAENDLSEAERALAWSSLVEVYPELQDWVARRGHGGAAPWVRTSSTASITALNEDVDVVAVQLHAGFQFQPAPSDFVANVARQAIDAGADIVICHHPHVLQGTEWYKDKLIVYSLGNFIFDQDFFATFPTAILRTVWEGDRLFEARFLPLELIGYRPMPVADAPAERTLLRLWEMSTAEARAARVGGGIYVIDTGLDPEVLPGQLRLERHTAVIRRESPGSEALPVLVPASSSVALGYGGLVNPHAEVDGASQDADLGIDVGRSLLGWGDFEDYAADGADTGFAQWAVDEPTSYRRLVLDEDAPEGRAFLRMSRTTASESTVVIRPVARTPIIPHRLYRAEIDEETQDESLVPADPAPSYTVRLKARRTGPGQPFVRLDLYLFDDTNPTEDPSSTVIGMAELALEVPDDGEWHDIEVAVGDELLTADDLRANMIMFYVGLAPTLEANTVLDVDSVELLEWRAVNQMPDRFGVYDYVRNRSGGDLMVNMVAMPE